MEGTITTIQNDYFINEFSIKEKGKFISVNIDDIIWFEADTNYVNIHHASKVYVKKTSLKELELRLNPTIFVRIHRSAIISFRHIQSIRPYFKDEYIIVLSNEKVLRLSRSYLDKIELIVEKIRQQKSV